MISKEALRKAVMPLVVLLLAGCANIYDANLFENFDGPPSASELANGSAEDIADAAESPQFFEELEDDPEAKEALQDRLQEIYNDPNASDSDRRTAAVVSGDIEMETTEGGEIVNNVVDVVLDEEGGGEFSDPGTFIRNTFPESVRNDPEELEAQIESFRTAAEAYYAYGEGLTEDGVPDGANSGEIAQRATVAILMDTLAEQAGGTDELVADIQADDYSSYSDPTESALGTEDEPEPLRNILDVAGLTSVVEGG
ncbi:MAG: hypothetical protein ACLFNP_08135 [Spirochaetaceae bacterium]